MSETIRHRGTRVHQEGRRPLLILGAVLIGWNLLALWRERGRLPWRGALLSLTAFGFLTQFFRIPGVTTPTAPDLVIAPAYGRIVHVGAEDEPEILKDRRIRVSIFLSVFNPHLVRAPLAGRVVYQQYHPGRYLVALHPKSSELNERNSVTIEGPHGTRVLIREIAGLLARRICSYTQVGAQVIAGSEIGFIKLGSRVDVFLPENAEILVQVGARTKAGETKIARLA